MLAAGPIGAPELILVLIIAGLYFLPTMIALLREHRQVAPIAVINFFLGWTFLGWVAALAWSVSGKTTAHA